MQRRYFDESLQALKRGFMFHAITITYTFRRKSESTTCSYLFNLKGIIQRVVLRWINYITLHYIDLYNVVDTHLCRSI